MKQRFQRIIDWFEHFSVRLLAPILSGVVGISGFIVTHDFAPQRREYPEFSGVWDVLSAPFWMFILVSSFLLLAANSGFLAWRAPTRNALRDERDKARDATAKIGENILLLMDGLLLNLSRRLDFSLNGHSRVSLYVFDERNKAFIPCGRFSHNPKYREKGRTKFAVNQGCIGRAWERDWAFDDQIPADLEAAMEYHKDKYGIPKSSGICSRMHVRVIAAKKILDSNSLPVGVIVVESDKEKAFGEKELKDVLVAVADDYGRIVRGLQPYIPDPGDAKKFGL